MANANLPEELVHEILLRLPVKALSRCKCVCKQWCALIGSTSFVNQHFGHESNRARLLVRLGKPDRKGCKYILYIDETFSEYEEPCHLQIPDAATITGPLNGVFCVCNMWSSGPVALLNPALRQFKPLPPLDPQFGPPNLCIDRSEIGLGLDPLTTGDYKLVLILYWEREIVEQGYHCLVFVCTSDSDSWKLVEDVDPIVSSNLADTSTTNTYLNGVYYWLLEFNFDEDTDVATILAFDMRTDKFRGIKVTGFVTGTKVGQVALHGDSLTLLMLDIKETDCYVDVWTMMDEGCWIKSSKVGPLDNIGWVQFFWKKKELLLQTTASFLTLCNVTTHELRAIEAQKPVDDDMDSHITWVFVYKESLVSVKGEAGKCKLWDTSSDFIKEFIKDSSERYA